MKEEPLFSDNAGLLDMRFDTVQVGDVLGPVELVVDEHLVRRFAYAVDDFAPAHLMDTSALGSRHGHSCLLVPNLLDLLSTRYNPDTDVGIHQKEEIHFCSPVYVGERVILTAKFVDKYVKRGKGYWVMEGEARAKADGRVIVRHCAHEIAGFDETVELGSKSAKQASRWVSCEIPPDSIRVDRGARDLPVGAIVYGPTKEVHQDQVSVFSNAGRFWRNMHTDLEAARAAGFSSTVVQGLMPAIYLAELAVNFFGHAWFTTGHLAVSFLDPAYPGDVLETRGKVVGQTEHAGEDRVELEAWTQTADGRFPAVGWLSARVS